MRSRCRGVIKKLRGTLEVYPKWLMANKRKTGGLNYSKAIKFGMPAGRGRKGKRPPRSRRGKQSVSVVVLRNPSSSVVANQSQNYPDRAQLHNLYPAPGPPSVAAHQMPRKEHGLVVNIVNHSQ